MKRKNMNGRGWADLPEELLEAIASGLKTRPDIWRFRAVCKNWRRSAPCSLLNKPLLSPLLPYTPRFRYNGISTGSVVLVANSVYLLRSSLDPTKPPWLVSVEEFNMGKFYLRKPLSDVPIRNLPDEFPRSLDVSKFHVSQVFRGYCFRNYVNIFVEERFLEGRWVYNYRWGVIKVVLFVNPDCSVNNPSINDCIAVYLCGGGDLYAIRLGDNEGYVAIIEPNRGGVKFDDIVNFGGKIYTVDQKGRAYSISYNTSKLMVESVVDQVDEICGMGRNVGSSDTKKWLVESSGNLYLLHSYHEEGKKSKSIHVYELDVKGHCWKQVYNLGGDRILFVTYEGCFFVSVKDLPSWTGGCVVFYRGCYNSFDYEIFKHEPHYYGLINIVVYYFDDLKSNSFQRFPNYSDLFWPPLAWISSDACSSSRSGDCAKQTLELSSAEEDELDSDSILKHSHDAEVSQLSLESETQEENTSVSLSGNPAEEQSSFIINVQEHPHEEDYMFNGNRDSVMNFNFL